MALFVHSWQKIATNTRIRTKPSHFWSQTKGFSKLSIYLMAIYGKSRQTDIDKDQLKLLAKQAHEWLG
ncbi:MAG: hypothetical protein ACRD6X_11450 [Pyrinomonadaceae bacterium]